MSMLIDPKGTHVQVNCQHSYGHINIAAGEDGLVKIYNESYEEYLPRATDKNGWLIQIDDLCLLEHRYADDNIITYIVIASPDGVIAIYSKSNTQANWDYQILLQNDECFYNIKEAHIDEPHLYMKVETEFAGIAEYNFEINA